MLRCDVYWKTHPALPSRRRLEARIGCTLKHFSYCKDFSTFITTTHKKLRSVTYIIYFFERYTDENLLKSTLLQHGCDNKEIYEHNK